jgi:hypothetical protein
MGKRLKNEKFTTADNEVMRLAHIAHKLAWLSF